MIHINDCRVINIYVKVTKNSTCMKTLLIAILTNDHIPGEKTQSWKSENCGDHALTVGLTARSVIL